MKTIERETTHDCRAKQCKKEQEEMISKKWKSLKFITQLTVDSNLLHLLKILQKFASTRAIVYNEKAEETEKISKQI